MKLNILWLVQHLLSSGVDRQAEGFEKISPFGIAFDRNIWYAFLALLALSLRQSLQCQIFSFAAEGEDSSLSVQKHAICCDRYVPKIIV